MFKELLDFLKSKTFFKNLAFAIVVIVLFFWGVDFFLSKYTRHGQYIILPNLSNIKLPAAEALLKNDGLNYIIIDSVYMANSLPGLVINQNPYAGAHVKNGRNIYLYITSTLPPLVEMPDLLDKSLRQAKNLLENNGLKLGEVHWVTAPMPGFVLQQTLKNRPIGPGAKIPTGSVIDVEIGKGNSIDTL